MPRIFDNIEQKLLPALEDALTVARRADFSVGYFNLRGWRNIDGHVGAWAGGDDACCRLLVGMQQTADETLRHSLRVRDEDLLIDNATASRLRAQLAQDFREQLTYGVPTNADEAGLRRLVEQLRADKLRVKLFLRHSLHAKLYLAHREDAINPIIGFVGSSNLTLPGLVKQGELNVDVLDHDAAAKLASWFEDRWTDRWSVDISSELIDVIESSWAREEPVPPYHVYLKMAYHLSQEARAGLSEFQIPLEFRDKLFEFQTAAVKIAAHHVNKRGGVLIGDVVGLGKTLMATALARILEDDLHLETLIICPPNLVSMWEDYRERYRLRARVLSIGMVEKELPDMRRYRVVIVDESHNLRNRSGKRYRAIQEYIVANESRCILLTATPYNKTFLDLASQLRLFLPEDQDLGIRPERLLKQLGETEFIRRHQASPRTLAAFEHSPYADDWRDLMRLYLVRRTRSFIQDNYAQTDEEGRRYLTMEDGTRSYFPTREPRSIPFSIDEKNPDDRYARLYSGPVVSAINGLHLPRYGLGNYVAEKPGTPPSGAEGKQLQDLGRAGKHLMGFSRTNLFKRLESGGTAFLQSVERHILRNYIYIHAIDNGDPLPLGSQDASFMDPATNDSDTGQDVIFEDAESSKQALADAAEADLIARASDIYGVYATRYRTRFRWLRSDLFSDELRQHLAEDAQALQSVLREGQGWKADADEKLSALHKLLTELHPHDKVLVFTQFADTARYLEGALRDGGMHPDGQTRSPIERLECVTGDTSSPTEAAWRFSPVSNGKRDRIAADDETRVLVATDVLSEGQNLQDAAIVVNFDLPWAIIGLVQRAGRIDRIGQRAERIVVYSFLPADGVERIISLRARVRQRLRENAEVVGTDEAFFEDEGADDRAIVDLYHEKSTVLDTEYDGEVDLASYAFQIWMNATKEDPALRKAIEDMASVSYSTKRAKSAPFSGDGVLVYLRTGADNDTLAWLDAEGNTVSQSQLEILKAAECPHSEDALTRIEQHHELVAKAVRAAAEEDRAVGGQLGRPSGARFRAYERLQQHAADVAGTLFETRELALAINDIYRYPLRPTAADTLNRQLRSGISNEHLASLVTALRDEGRLVLEQQEVEQQEPQIICSLGLREEGA